MQQLNEAPSNNKSLEQMTTTELQALAEQLGFTFDNAESRSEMLSEISQVLTLKKMYS